MSTLSVPPPQREQPPRLTAYGSVFFWGAALLLFVGFLAWVIIVWGGVEHFTDPDAARVLERVKIRDDINAADYKYLHDKPGYFKKDAGLVRVPIDEAMAMTLPALQANKPHAAYPIAQSPPQNSAAPSSPDKGAGQDAKPPGKTNDNNPPASNPTVGQPSPAPVAPAPTPAPPAAPAPAATPTPAPTVAPTPAPTAMPSPAAEPPAINNANNPGTPPVPGTQPQPAAPPAETNTSGMVATPTPAVTGAQPAPLTHPPAQPTPEATATPVSATTPTPNPQEPGATPAGTP